ncbi:Fungal specific transcription factor domain-containing protein [Cladophialophora immunda]|nr:Fungal specific transcription factor domain-containing protein [Cladophialophora immunda]
MQEQTSELPPLTIPPGHEASSSNLLSLPQVETLAGEFPDEFFFRVEAHHAKVMETCSSNTVTADSSDIPQVGREAADMFLQAFFELVHPFHPIFDRKAFTTLYEDAFAKALCRNEESGVVFVVLALGAVISEDPDGKHTLGGRTIPGIHYYRAAQQILMSRWTQSVGGNLLLSQGLLLCALYLTYAVQPLLAWKFVHLASTNVEQLLIRTKNAEPDEPRVQEILRLSWSSFVIECDILAEFHQPRSCIQLLADKMLFPHCGDPPDTSRMLFLAEISARSLGNRIHYSINFTDSMSAYTDSVLDDVPDGTGIANSLAPLINVCNELTRQLESWYSSLPAAIKPELVVEEPDPDIQSCLLRCRYWSSMNKIHRPFVLKATSLPTGQQVPQYFLEKCQTCIMSCRMFLKSVGGLLVRRTPYIYTATQGAFASALMISISARSPILKPFVTDVDALQHLALDRLRPWAEDGSAAESAYEILSSIRKKFIYCERM